MLKQFTAIIHKEDDIYVSLCPELEIASLQGTHRVPLRLKPQD
jgi:hypothetical protein